VRNGLLAFNTLQDYKDYDVRTHHTNTDFYERLSEEELQEGAIVLATFLYHAAMRDEKIPSDLTP
jgi:carboxypeptidase Q